VTDAGALRQWQPDARRRRPVPPFARVAGLLAAGLIVVSGAIGSARPQTASAASGVLFSDGFESGSFSAWSSPPVVLGDGSATVQTGTVRTGTYAARFSESSLSTSSAYIRQAISPSQTEVRVAGDFNVQTEGVSGANVPLIRVFSSTGVRLVSLYRQNATGGKIYVQHSGAFNTTTGVLPLSTWASFELHVIVNGATSTVEVRMNGALIHQSTTATLGSDPVLNVQLGNDTKGQTFALFADNVVVTDGSSTTPSPSPSSSRA